MIKKAPLFLLLLAAVGFTTSSCSTPEQRKARDARYAREDARREAEDKRRDARYDEDRWQDFLTDYANRLGKVKSELTQAERSEARREFDRGGYGYGYGYGYRHWYW